MSSATIPYLLVLLSLLPLEAFSQERRDPAEVWRVSLPDSLRSRVNQAVILPGTSSVVVTSTQGLWRIDDAGEVAPIAWFERLEATEDLGLSATLSADGSRVGVLKHDHHALAGFDLFDLQGDAVATVPDTQTFHYRIAPGGGSFVGIDAGGEHVQVNASRFVYHLFDQTGRRIADIESLAPRPFDSAYSADGEVLVLNNRDGLSAYGANDGGLRWKAAMAARTFAAANAATGVVAATDAQDRTRVAILRNGEQIRDYRLDGNSRNIAVSPNGQFVLAADATTAHMLTPGSERALWQIGLPEAGYTIRSIAVSDAGLALIGAQHENLKSGTVIVADQSGGVLYRQDLPLQRSNAWIPTVQLGWRASPRCSARSKSSS